MEHFDALERFHALENFDTLEGFDALDHCDALEIITAFEAGKEETKIGTLQAKRSTFSGGARWAKRGPLSDTLRE